MINEIGLIQGRLSERPFPELQRFPHMTWEKEFYSAKEIGYDFLEWIFEYNDFESNPLYSDAGRKEIRKIIESSEMPVHSVCADYFLEKPFYRNENYSIENNIDMLIETIKMTSDIGADRILLPVLEKAELRTVEEAKLLIYAIEKCIPVMEKNNVKIGFETELKANDYKKLCDYFKHPLVGAYYDTGNCAFRGYDMQADMKILEGNIIGIHVKDRKIGGESVFLGTGDTNFRQGIPQLLEQGYSGEFTLQTYFEDDYYETAARNLIFMRKIVGI